MERIKQVIACIDTPSWLSRVPRNFGDAAAGTLKADEWRTLSTVHLPLALVSIWGEGSNHPDAATATTMRDILDHTMHLVCATSLVCKRVMTMDRARRFRDHYAAWQRDLPVLHPGIVPRTNHHVGFHIYEFITLFGSVYSWWCFPFERLIGLLQRIPQNHRFGDLELTLLDSFLRASALRRWLARPDCPPQ